MKIPAAAHIGPQLVRGFAMGAADIVPGVSGGTVALVLGIYDRLIDNVRLGARGLRQLLTGDISSLRKTVGAIEWVWLFSLLAGILVAVFALSSILDRLLTDEPIKMSALFLGLVVGTVFIAARMLERVDAATSVLVLAVGVAVFLLLGLKSDTAVAEDADEIVTQPLWVFFVVGAIAICAMILPGISGSFLLVMMGMYTEVIGAAKDRDLLTLAVFGAGAVVGLALFSTLLNWLLDRYHHWVIAAMIGLMLGSTRVLWPWPNGTNTTTLSAPAGDVAVPVLLGVVGVVVVVAIELLGSKLSSAATD